ncbi:hypothetical protein EPN52_02115 [bacterium]|nr:MAG: hypothetical protein EPN52_02115 [bacterium]
MAVACGGGGGGSSPVTPGGSGPPVALSGLVTDDASPLPSPLAGATVSIYKAGVALTGAVPLATATTSPTGMWSVAVGPPPGSYLLQIAPADGGHATLHRNVTLAPGANAISSPQLTVLSAMEQQCITLFNQRRVALGVPSLPVDNAAMIAARAEAAGIAAWSGLGTPPNGTAAAYASAGGLGNVTGDDYDSGASDCAMATANMFAANNSFFPQNSGAAMSWFGFGIHPDPVGNSDFAAAVVQYP